MRLAVVGVTVTFAVTVGANVESVRFLVAGVNVSRNCGVKAVRERDAVEGTTACLITGANVATDRLAVEGVT